MEIFFSTFTLFYCSLVLILFLGWKKIPLVKKTSISGEEDWPFLSIIIPVRNESAGILNLLNDLNQQSFPKGHFEVIVVDDFSTDDTVQKVNNHSHKLRIDLKVISLTKKLGGKKKALRTGIDQAKGEIIVTTDGDCRADAEWLACINAAFLQQQRMMVCGPVTFHNEASSFERLQTIEFASLIGTGAASLYYNFPNMCNGANLAFKKKAFESVNGYTGSDHIPSGDDEFLMHKMHEKYPGQVCFLKAKGAIVKTSALNQLKGFINQRKRWSGKWNLHGLQIKVLALIIFLYNLSLIAAFISSFLGYYQWNLLFIQLFFKILFEYLFLNEVLRFLDKKIKVFYFLLLQLIYPLYVVFFGLAANTGNYKWKERTY